MLQILIFKVKLVKINLYFPYSLGGSCSKDNMRDYFNREKNNVFNSIIHYSVFPSLHMSECIS